MNLNTVPIPDARFEVDIVLQLPNNVFLRLGNGEHDAARDLRFLRIGDGFGEDGT